MTGAPTEALPAVALLTGPDAARVLERALPEGTRLERLETVQVTGSPGKRTAVRYVAELASAYGGTSTEILVAFVDRRGVPEGISRVTAGGEEIAVWRASEDPELPSLADALNHTAVLDVFRRLGIDAVSVRLTVRAYRPRSRAVVEAVAEVQDEPARLVMTPGGLRPAPDERRLFLKALRPGAEEALAAIHERLGTVMPVPRVLGLDRRGLLVLEALPGRTLRSCLRNGRTIPAPSEVVALAAAPSGLDLGGRDAESSDERVAWSLGLLCASLPEERERLDRLAERLLGATQQPPVTIHGDFHEGQIVVHEGLLRGVIDLDDAGRGELVEDLGLIIGRLWTLAQERGDRSIAQYVDGLLGAAERRVPSDELRRRVGVSLFARATAPFRNQTDGWHARAVGRLAICEAWLDGG